MNINEILIKVEEAKKSAGLSGEPLVSAELAAALGDGGSDALQIVLNAAVERGDYKVVAYCMQLINARLRELGKAV